VPEDAVSDLTSHWRLTYGDKYLGAWSLFDKRTGRYREVTARIDRVSDEEVIGEGWRRSRPVQLWLCGSKGPIPVPMILSKSNGTTLQVMTGSPIPKNWEGTTITIYVRKSKRVLKGSGDVLTIRNTKGSTDMREELEARVPAIAEEDLVDPAEDPSDGATT
jgi:hypothetical protein